MLALVSRSSRRWEPRWSVLDEWRDLRYGRDDVISTIPVELQSTDFEYHGSDFDEAVLDLTAFLSAADETWTVDPPTDRDASKASTIEDILQAVFGMQGVLETEAGDEVTDMVWQNQVENGQGYYKLTLKRDYPLALRRQFADKPGDGYEENPEYDRRSRVATRAESGTSRYRETDEAREKRISEYMQSEFAWEWRYVDPRWYFEVTKDNKVVIAGEVTERSLESLDDGDRASLSAIENNRQFLSRPSERGGGDDTVRCFEAWSEVQGFFGFVGSDHSARLAREWSHPYRRVPYFPAIGLTTTDPGIEYRYAGAFGKMIPELTLLNHLETMHFNAIHRGYFPLYQAVKDPSFGGEVAPLETEQFVNVAAVDAEKQQLPPGWRWEVMPSGFEPDLGAQLVAARERVKQSAVTQVLTGASPGAGDSGAKISLLINAANRALSPFTRHHSAARKEMAQMMLDVNKRVGIDTHITVKSVNDEGNVVEKKMTLKADDIVSCTVANKLTIFLPVDQAAQEARGLTLWQAGAKSYRSVAPEFFGVGDPERERDRIAIEKRENQIDEIAFQLASKDFEARSPSIFTEMLGVTKAMPPAPTMDDDTAGGGPGGVHGGATTMLGRGGPSLPTATQVDGTGAR